MLSKCFIKYKNRITLSGGGGEMCRVISKNNFSLFCFQILVDLNAGYLPADLWMSSSERENRPKIFPPPPLLQLLNQNVGLKFHNSNQVLSSKEFRKQ